MTSVVLRIMVNSQCSLNLTPQWPLTVGHSFIFTSMALYSSFPTCKAFSRLLCWFSSLARVSHSTLALFPFSLHSLPWCFNSLAWLKCHLPSRDFRVCIYSSISLLYLTFPLEGLIETFSLICPKLSFSSSSPKPMSLYHPSTDGSFSVHQLELRPLIALNALLFPYHIQMSRKDCLLYSLPAHCPHTAGSNVIDHVDCYPGFLTHKLASPNSSGTQLSHRS